MNKKGQMTLESVLIMTVLLAIFVSVSSYFRDNQLLSQLVHGPWARMSGMIKYGVWAEDQDGISSHPNVYKRINTVRGEEPQ